MSADPRLLGLSNRIYSLLLYAYPAPFRQDFGDDMAQVFRDDVRRTLRNGGLLMLAGLWLVTLFDWLKTAIAEHIWETFHMPVDKLTRWSGLAAIGAPLFYLTFLSQPFWNMYGALGLPDHELAHPLMAAFGLLLMGIGLYGLYRRLPATPASKLSLLVALLGVLAGLVAMAIFNSGGLETALMFVVMILPPLGLAGLGVIALTNRSLGIWSVVPLATVAAFLGFIAAAGPGGNVTLTGLARSLFYLYCLGWIALGVSLILNQTEAGPSEPRLPA